MFDSVRRLFQPAQAQPAVPQDWKKQGNDFLAGGDLPQAARCYREAVAADPRDAAACLNLGFVLDRKSVV